MFFHCYILRFHLGCSKLNQISLSKLIILKFISPGDLCYFFLLFIYSRISRDKVLGHISGIIDFLFGRNVKMKRLTPEINVFIGSVDLL